MSALLALLLSAPADAVRTKDVGTFFGYRDNQITGAGLVVGLNRTGDSTRNLASIRSLANRLQGLGVSLQVDDIRARNVALVMVTATMPPNARLGQRLDVTVASTGDASSLAGGILLLTPLMGGDGNIVAVSEGSLVVGGFSASSDGNGTQKNNPTVGRVVGGALVEREVPSQIDYNALQSVDFVLREPDFTTATRLADAVNADFEAEVAVPVTASTVALNIPEPYRGKFPSFAARIESVDLDVDTPARVVINERTGTVVMGADVRVSAVAVAHGGLTIEVRRVNEVSQPSLLSAGTTSNISNTTVVADEEDGQLVVVEGVNIGDIVSALNALGVKPRDLIVILQAIKASGALHAEIVTL